MSELALRLGFSPYGPDATDDVLASRGGGRGLLVVTAGSACWFVGATHGPRLS